MPSCSLCQEFCAGPVLGLAPTCCVGWEDEAGEVNVAHQHTSVGFLWGRAGGEQGGTQTATLHIQPWSGLWC